MKYIHRLSWLLYQEGAAYRTLHDRSLIRVKNNACVEICQHTHAGCEKTLGPFLQTANYV